MILMTYSCTHCTQKISSHNSMWGKIQARYSEVGDGTITLCYIQKIFHSSTKMYLSPFLLSDQTLRSLIYDLSFYLTLT